MSVKVQSPAFGQERSRTNLEIAKHNRSPLSKRMRTAIRSFMVIRSLTAEQVDSFMRSYIIYDLDWADEKRMVEALGPDYQQKVGACLADYYGVLNHLCAIGELEKMYIPPIMDSHEGITVNQLLYEESVARELELPPDSRVLDLGCGRGRVAAHIARVTSAQVTGINIDGDQLASAIEFNRERKLSNIFIRRDFNDLPLPFPDNYFDGFYQIQAFSLVKNLEQLLKETFRVLKPGSRVSMLDWVSLPAYDPSNPHHLQLMRNIKPLIGAVGTPTPMSMRSALESAGFRLVEMGNASIDGLQAPLIEQADTYFDSTRSLLTSLVRVKMLPSHFKTLFDRLTKDGQSFIEADRARLVTTSYHWLAEKPHDSDAVLMKQELADASASDSSMVTSASSVASPAEPAM